MADKKGVINLQKSTTGPLLSNSKLGMVKFSEHRIFRLSACWGIYICFCDASFISGTCPHVQFMTGTFISYKTGTGV